MGEEPKSKGRSAVIAVLAIAAAIAVAVPAPAAGISVAGAATRGNDAATGGETAPFLEVQQTAPDQGGQTAPDRGDRSQGRRRNCPHPGGGQSGAPQQSQPSQPQDNGTS